MMPPVHPPTNYERFFVPAIGAPLANDLLQHAALRSGERVLDVACGTGIVARLASREVGADGTVAGLDVNPSMLAVARSAAETSGRIEWHEASAEMMPFPDASFDVVLCQMGLQFVPDKPTALSEMHRVLKPGGRLLFNLPGPTPPLFAIMQEAFARHVGPEAAGFVNQVFSLHDTAEIEKLVRSTGFHHVSVRAEIKSLPLPAPEEFFWQYVNSTPLAGVVVQAGKGPCEMLERDVVGKWQNYVEDGRLVLRVRLIVAAAQRAEAGPDDSE